MAGGEVDRLFGLHFAGDVVEHAVAHVDGVVEPDEASRDPTAARSSRSQAMVSIPCAANTSRTAASVNRATPMIRLDGAARLASRARVGPILPLAPRIVMSPSMAERSRISAAEGSVMKSSSAASSSKRDGMLAAVGMTGFRAQSAPAGTAVDLRRPMTGLRRPGSKAPAVAATMAADPSQT